MINHLRHKYGNVEDHDRLMWRADHAATSSSSYTNIYKRYTSTRHLQEKDEKTSKHA